jgi:beta-glucosidase/6-phospho-beta-glucosidase/beta-galactosidase
LQKFAFPGLIQQNMKLFKTFFIGGYECADMINNRGNRVDLLKDTFHDVRVAEDYTMLAAAGIATVREGIRWSVVEKTPHHYDFSEVKARIAAAQKYGIQQLWDICHFGYPDGLVPSHPQFAERFAGMCKAFVDLYRSTTDDPLIITPINEISFISWLGGDARGTVPFAIHSGFDVKYFLCRAAIKGIEAIKALDPTAKILMVEPLIRVHPQQGKRAGNHIKGINNAQFQAMDMVTGRLCPELGGRPDYMDIAGFNYYYENQWEHCGPIIGWTKEHRRTCFSELLGDAYRRYGKPVILSETGHFKEDRAKWMEQITDDCIKAMKRGVDLRGICIYPVLDRPDWDEMRNIECGIWGYDPVTGARTVEAEYLARVQHCHERLNKFLEKRESTKLKQCSQRLQPMETF